MTPTTPTALKEEGKKGYHVGQQIRDIRKKQKRTMLSVAMELGVDYQHLQRIELTGKATVESIEKIATVLQHGIIIYPTKINFKNGKETLLHNR